MDNLSAKILLFIKYRLKFVATIKNHEEYKGVKQTEITRAKAKAIDNEIDS